MSIGSAVIPEFFFSSRRRQTRYWRDGSSDVCSSDLHLAAHPGDWTVLDEDEDGVARGGARPSARQLERGMLQAVGAAPDDPPWGVRLGRAAPDATPS